MDGFWSGERREKRKAKFMLGTTILLQSWVFELKYCWGFPSKQIACRFWENFELEIWELGNEFEWWDLSVEIWKLSTLVWLSVIEVKFKIRTSQSSTHTNSPKVSWILTPTRFQLEPTRFTYLDRSNQNLGWSRLQIQFSSFASFF